MPKTKLKSAELKGYKERLVGLRRRLRGDVSAMASSALRKSGGESSSVPVHLADLGSDNFDQEFTLSLMKSEEGMLNKIEVALERIQSKQYGLCEACDRAIPKTRLNALPHTTYCVSCAETIQTK